MDTCLVKLVPLPIMTISRSSLILKRELRLKDSLKGT